MEEKQNHNYPLVILILLVSGIIIFIIAVSSINYYNEKKIQAEIEEASKNIEESIRQDEQETEQKRSFYKKIKKKSKSFNEKIVLIRHSYEEEHRDRVNTSLRGFNQYVHFLFEIRNVSRPIKKLKFVIFNVSGLAQEVMYQGEAKKIYNSVIHSLTVPLDNVDFYSSLMRQDDVKIYISDIKYK